MKPAFLVLPLAGAALLSGCGAGGAINQRPSAVPPVMPMASSYGRTQGLIGVDARKLVSLLGKPRLDIRDPTVHKMQFAAGRCIIDAYLYAPAAGREPVTTYVDSRLATGEDIDIANCGLPAR